MVSRAADALDLALLQHAQHLGLRVAPCRRSRRGTACRRAACSNLPRRCCVRAGERALLVAEQLALDQLARDRRAVELHERPVCALASARGWRARQLLAGAALAGDEHAARRRRRLGGSCRRCASCAATADHVAKSAARLRAQLAACSRSRRASLSALRTVMSTLSVVSGFSRKSQAPSLVASTAVASVALPDIIITGSSRLQLAQRLERGEAVHLGHGHVEQHAVERLGASPSPARCAPSPRPRRCSPRARARGAGWSGCWARRRRSRSEGICPLYVGAGAELLRGMTARGCRPSVGARGRWCRGRPASRPRWPRRGAARFRARWPAPGPAPSCGRSGRCAGRARR